MRHEHLMVSELEMSATGYIYFGPKEKNGTWRFYIKSDELVFERCESGSYVEKGKFTIT